MGTYDELVFAVQFLFCCFSAFMPMYVITHAATVTYGVRLIEYFSGQK